MKKNIFLHDNFLLENDFAIELYHQYAKDLPIIDYHNHSYGLVSGCGCSSCDYKQYLGHRGSDICYLYYYKIFANGFIYGLGSLIKNLEWVGWWIHNCWQFWPDSHYAWLANHSAWCSACYLIISPVGWNSDYKVAVTLYFSITAESFYSYFWRKVLYHIPMCAKYLFEFI